MEEAACACRDMVALGTKTPRVGVIWQQLTSDMKSSYVDTFFTGTLLKEKLIRNNEEKIILFNKGATSYRVLNARGSMSTH